MHGDQMLELTPSEFEKEVKALIERNSAGLKEFRAEHLEKVKGTDGDYIIDVTARFKALGEAEYITLIECKHLKRRVERADLQVLNDKLRSTGAHKGIVFSVSGFQQGAKDYAEVNKISLCQLVDGSEMWLTRSLEPTGAHRPDWLPATSGWFIVGNMFHSMDSEGGWRTRQALGLEHYCE